MTFKDTTTKFPIPYRSNHTLSCEGLFILTGDSTVVCAGGSDFSYSSNMPQCSSSDVIVGKFKLINEVFHIWAVVHDMNIIQGAKIHNA